MLQLKEIKVLKGMVKNVKLNLADHRIEDVKFEENQVSYLKREY